MTHAQQYTVGWVCALLLETAAAKGMLDQVHTNLPEQDAADHNSYGLGQIQGHNVVNACLQASTELPRDRRAVYEKILGRINHNRRQEAQTLFHIVVAARRPLTVSEMNVAFQLATDATDARAQKI
ncbi:hypothetical protein CGRA01v4_02191 [Colletotrichum graminicola]|uniref:Uncharacterized protein n=1 Tax=Colletotrichum graminicola (strain M1.001 / M2 / FGSC 10212) TaxID=645133 RepID=E3Q3Y3_COLGM|nr:uncharacterized protein GLRG_00879 [Colletotrichum graminicola M1.001]EFQ25735.1 hypothetical protein GLRG_00879 [Colletotrichum graminicola M1.001]WDK10912.1 hypothetical protein CGRA01v4_02191 [Colletotrichum graminicola]